MTSIATGNSVGNTEEHEYGLKFDYLTIAEFCTSGTVGGTHTEIKMGTCISTLQSKHTVGIVFAKDTSIVLIKQQFNNYVTKPCT